MLNLDLRDAAALGKSLQRAFLELRAGLTNRLTFGENMLAAVVDLTLTTDGIVSGTELQRKDPRLFKPIGFFPLAVMDAAGGGLGIASWVFNPTPSSGAGWHGLTITVTSGTIATARGVLVGG
jgi:hypothetical protein